MNDSKTPPTADPVLDFLRQGVPSGPAKKSDPEDHPTLHLRVELLHGPKLEKMQLLKCNYTQEKEYPPGWNGTYVSGDQLPEGSKDILIKLLKDFLAHLENPQP